MEAAGIKVLKINSGNPAVFGHTAPESVKKIIRENLDRAVPYCNYKGMPEARDAISDYCAKHGFRGVTPDDIYTGNGVSELADIALTALLNDGDEVLMPMPCYPLWSNCAKKIGGVPVYYTCDEKSMWYPDIDDMKRKVTPKTKAIVVINPNNPTGALYPDEILEAIVDIARENHLMILSDEIYDRLIFEGNTHTPIAKIASDLFVVTFNGLSKSHNICGYRCGWLVISGPRSESEEFRSNVDKLTSLRLCAGAIPQLIIPSALADSESTRKAFAPGGAIYERRRAAIDAISESKTLTCVKNDGALYIFPRIRDEFNVSNDHDFAKKLLEEKHILLVPGTGFNCDYNNHFRIVLLPSPEELALAVRAIDDVLVTNFI